MGTVLADIIIINYNSVEYTLNCIDSVKRHINCRVRIIVIDNNSKQLPDKIMKIYPNIDFIQNSENVGFGKAINLSLKFARSKYIVLLNPDAAIIDHSFNNIFNYLDKHSQVAIAGPMILDHDGSIQGSARRFPTIWTSIFGRKSPLTRLFPRNQMTKREFFCFNGDNQKPKSVDWVSGACMVIRTDILKYIGGFDDKFFMYWEDADLCKRLKESGWKIIYYPQAKIFHHTGKSSDTRPLSSIYHFHKSCYLYFKKHTNMPVLLTAPFALWGLSLRCLFVMCISEILSLMSKDKSVYKETCLNSNDKKKHASKIKVLRIVSRLNIGGPSIHCSILTKGLNKNRFVSQLVAGAISPKEGDMSYLIGDNDGILIKVPELQREINFKNDLKAFIRISKLLFEIKPDIVHTHMAKASAIGRAAVFLYNIVAIKKRIRSVHTFHGNVLEGYFSTFKSKIFINIEKVLAKVTDAIIAISQTQKWELTKKFKLADNAKVHIINLGLDLTKLTEIKDKGVLRSSLGIGNETILIGIVGRLVPIKNHILFLDSAKLIKEKYPNKSIRFVIVGDGELRDNLEAYGRQIGINEHVIFYGWEKEIQNIYADLDVLLLTSDNEGTPVSIIESMAASVPVVTTGVGGVKDLLGRIEKKSYDLGYCCICERGILCPKGNPEAVAAGIAFSIENDNSVRVQRAKKFVLETYSDQKLIHRIEQLYESLMQT